MASAVITADIVNSTLLSAGQQRKLIGQLTSPLKNHLFEFYRGDSLQVYLKSPEDALQIILQLRSTARAFDAALDLRAGIGVGSVKKPVKLIKLSTGTAFVLSGRSFDELKPPERLKIVSGNELANLPLSLIALFADYVFNGLTSRQAEVIKGLLADQTQMAVAKKLKKAQATVSKHAQAGGWYAIEQLLTGYRQVFIQHLL